jgi:hypothetical protein
LSFLMVDSTASSKRTLPESDNQKLAWPQGVNVNPLLTPRGENTLLFRRTEGQTKGFHPLEAKVPPWVANFTPGAHISPLP